MSRCLCPLLACSRFTRTAQFFAVCLAMLLSAPTEAQPKPAIGPQQRLDVGGGTFGSAETTCAVGAANPLEVVAAWIDWRTSPPPPIEYKTCGVALTLDGGETWTDFLVRPPEPYQTTSEGDPMTAYDPHTGCLWVGALAWGSPCSIFVARKDPGASEFNPSVTARVSAWVDKCWMAAGPRPGAPDSTRLYITYDEGILWSDDMGETWTDPNPLGTGLGFLPRLGPGGAVYIAYWDLGYGMMLKRSFDGGETFTTHQIATRMDTWATGDGSRFPGTFRVPPLAYLDVDMNTGHLYAAYFDTTEIVGGQANVDLYFTKSTDQGTSWSAPVIANGDADPPGDQFFCWLEVDEGSRLHMVYFDSRHTEQTDGAAHGMLDAYYAYSVNDGGSWMEFRLTPQSWDSMDDAVFGGGQFVGDYLGMGVAGRRAYPVYIDTSAGDSDIFTNVVQIPCPGDVNVDGVVDVLDLIKVLGDWGPCADPDGCDADLDGDGTIDVLDLLEVLAAWGPC